MSHDNSLIPKKHPYAMRFGQRPLTYFKDYRKSIKVELTKHDDREKMLNGVYDFVTATWSEDGRESERVSEETKLNALKQMLEGKSLSLGLEAINLTFKISGISRIDTHQIVRQRVGVTFSQHCSGDQWWSHRDCLVPESVAQNDELLKQFIKTTLIAKNTYVDLIDSQNVSIQDARGVLPHNLDTFINMHTNISTLLFFYQKRIDDSSQSWQINEIARQMAEEVCKVYPEMADVFKKYSTKFTMAKNAEADRSSTFATALYIPKVDSYAYHERDYLYNKTKENFNFTSMPIEDTYYWGHKNISKTLYDKIYSMYMQSAKDVDEKHLSNIEIQIRNRELNREIELTI